VLFNSISFLVSFAIFALVYYPVPHERRWILLTVASLGFYALFSVVAVLVLLGVTLIAYLGGLAIASAVGRRRRSSTCSSETAASVAVAGGAAPVSGARAFIRRAALFTLGAVVLYVATCAAAEALVYRYGHRNRFFAIRTTLPADFGFVVLGASHAAVFDYRDMNARLERLVGTRIMNLSVVGGGVTVNRLLLEYFLTRHRTRAVLYVVDSFAFYSPAWNGARLQDARLFARAPLDPALIPLLWKAAPASVVLDYASDHLNRDRVFEFYGAALAPLLTNARESRAVSEDPAHRIRSTA
jgi:hypothetical protein